MANPVKPIKTTNRVTITFGGTDYVELITSMEQWIHGKDGVHPVITGNPDVAKSLKAFAASITGSDMTDKNNDKLASIKSIKGYVANVLGGITGLHSNDAPIKIFEDEPSFKTYAQTLSVDEMLLAAVMEPDDHEPYRGGPGHPMFCLFTRGADADLSDSSFDWRSYRNERVKFYSDRTEFQNSVATLADGGTVVGIIKDVTQFSDPQAQLGDSKAIFPGIKGTSAWVIGYGIKETTGESIKYIPTSEYYQQMVVDKVDKFTKDMDKKFVALGGTFLDLKTDVLENDQWLGNMSNDPEITPATGPGAGTNKNPGPIKMAFKERMKTFDPLKSYSGFGWFRYDNLRGPEPFGPPNQHSPTWAYNVGAFWLTQIVPRSEFERNGIEVMAWPHIDKSKPFELTARAYYLVKRIDPVTGVENNELMHKQVNFNLDRETCEVYIDVAGGSRQTGIQGSTDIYSSYRIITENRDSYLNVDRLEVPNKMQIEERFKGREIDLPGSGIPSEDIPAPEEVGNNVSWETDDDHFSARLSLGRNGTNLDNQLFASAQRWTGTELETCFLTINLKTHSKPGVVECILINKTNPTGFGLNVSKITIK